MSTTPNLGLALQTHGVENWDTALNGALSTIDTFAGTVAGEISILQGQVSTLQGEVGEAEAAHRPMGRRWGCWW